MGRKKKNQPTDQTPLSSKKETDDYYLPRIFYAFGKKYFRLDFLRLSESDLELLFYSSAQVVALWQDRQSFVTRAYNITQKENSPEHEFIKQHFDLLNFPDLAKKIQTAVLFGLSLQEIIWEILPDGKFWPKAFIDLPADRFYWQYGSVYWQEDRERKNPIPRQKILATRYNPLAKDRPFGLMRVLAGPIEAGLKNEWHWDEMIRKNNGGVYAFYLAKPNDADKRKAEVTMVGKKVAEGEVAAFTLGAGEKAELLEPKSKGTQGDIYKTRAKEIKDTESKLILGQTLTSDSGANASFAIGEVHAGTRENLAKNDMHFVSTKINELIRLIIDVNFPNPKAYPKFEYDQLHVVDMTRAQRDQILANSLGVEFTEDYIENMHNVEKGKFKMKEIPLVSKES